MLGPVQDSFGGFDGDLLSIDLKASPSPLFHCIVGGGGGVEKGFKCPENNLSKIVSRLLCLGMLCKYQRTPKESSGTMSVKGVGRL